MPRRPCAVCQSSCDNLRAKRRAHVAGFCRACAGNTSSLWSFRAGSLDRWSCFCPARGSNCRDQAIRIIGAQRQSSPIAQLDGDRIPAGDVVKPAPAIWRGNQMNPPTVPPANANGLEGGDLRQRHLLADQSAAEAGSEHLVFNLDRQLTEYNRRQNKDHENAEKNFTIR